MSFYLKDYSNPVTNSILEFVKCFTAGEKKITGEEKDAKIKQFRQHLQKLYNDGERIQNKNDSRNQAILKLLPLIDPNGKLKKKFERLFEAILFHGKRSRQMADLDKGETPICEIKKVKTETEKVPSSDSELEPSFEPEEDVKDWDAQDFWPDDQETYQNEILEQAPEAVPNDLDKEIKLSGNLKIIYEKVKNLLPDQAAVAEFEDIVLKGNRHEASTMIFASLLSILDNSKYAAYSEIVSANMSDENQYDLIIDLLNTLHA